MRPIIIDQDTRRELWRVKECAAHIGITPATWKGYVSHGRAPQPIAHLDGRTPLWWPEEVKAWHANRPGSPVKNHPTAHGQH